MQELLVLLHFAPAEVSEWPRTIGTGNIAVPTSPWAPHHSQPTTAVYVRWATCVCSPHMATGLLQWPGLMLPFQPLPSRTWASGCRWAWSSPLAATWLKMQPSHGGSNHWVGCCCRRCCWGGGIRRGGATCVCSPHRAAKALVVARTHAPLLAPPKQDMGQ